MDQQLPPIPANAINPLLGRHRIPGESVTLPSGGIFYTNGELSPEIENGELHVYPMTAVDELVMKSVDKVFSGQAVKEVFQRCIPGVVNVGALSAKDVDFLLVALRKVSYGPTFEMIYTHDCTDAKQNSYDVPLDTFIRGVRRLNPTTTKAQFEYKVATGETITFKPASYDDIIKIYQEQHANMLQDEEIADAEQLDRILNSVATMIRDVDGTTNTDHIVEWLKSVPVLWLKDISEAAKNTTEWGVEFEVEVVCKDCQKTIKVPTPLNPISFFI